MDEEIKNLKGITLEEQETVINFGWSDKDMTIYTTDRTMITKLDKLVEDGEYEVIEEHKLQNGRVIGKTYKADKSLLTLRAKKRVLTEEQKNKLINGLNKAR